MNGSSFKCVKTNSRGSCGSIRWKNTVVHCWEILLLSRLLIRALKAPLQLQYPPVTRGCRKTVVALIRSHQAISDVMKMQYWKWWWVLTFICNARPQPRFKPMSRSGDIVMQFRTIIYTWCYCFRNFLLCREETQFIYLPSIMEMQKQWSSKYLLSVKVYVNTWK